MLILQMFLDLLLAEGFHACRMLLVFVALQRTIKQRAFRTFVIVGLFAAEGAILGARLQDGGLDLARRRLNYWLL